MPVLPRYVSASTLTLATAFLVPFLVYLNTLPPTITGEDAGELVIAAWSLGIPHPPGYPLWCLAVHPFTWLPLGEVAWRVSLSSAVFGAAAATVLCACLLRLSVGRLASLTGALAFALSSEMWEQSIIPEVYALNALCLALSLYLLIRWRQSQDTAWLWLLAVLYGFSLGGHNTVMLLGPLYAVFVLWTDQARRSHAFLYAGLVVSAFACAVIIYSYLPLRSLADPVMDWGNPETLQAWSDVVMRKQYAFMLEQNPRSATRFLRQIAEVWRMWGEALLPPFAVTALVGLVLLLFRDLAWGALTASIALAVPIGFTLAQNFNLDPEWLWVMSVFFIPSHMMAGIWAAHLLAQLRPIFRYVLALCLVAPLSLFWLTNDMSNARYVRAYAEDILTNAPENAVIVSNADHFNFPATYLQETERLRPDVAVLRRYGYFDLGKLPEIPEPMRSTFGEMPRKKTEEAILTWLLENTGRALLVTPESLVPRGYDTARHGYFLRVLRPGELPDQEEVFASYGRHWQDIKTLRDDYTQYAIFCEYNFARAAAALHEGSPEQALDALRTEFILDDAPRLNNAGILFARHGNLSIALELFERAAVLQPDNAAISRNLARARSKINGNADP